MSWDRDEVTVYADTLAAAGDPRGELIALEVEDHGTTIEIDARRGELIVEDTLRHRAVFARLRCRVRLDFAALAALDRFETTHHMRLPPSVYWWYARKHVAVVSRELRHPLRPIASWELERMPDGEGFIQVFDAPRRRYGVLCDPADPPVVNRRASTASYAHIADTFSAYLARLATDSRLDFAHLD